MNIYNFVKPLKVAWIRQLVMGHNQQWFKLFANHNGNTKIMGEWCTTKERIACISNRFWLEVFDNWKILCKSQKVKTNSDTFQSRIWYNTDIFEKPLYLKKWLQHGITHIGDVIDSVGCLMTRGKMQIK